MPTRRKSRDEQRRARADMLGQLTAELTKLDALISRAKKYVRAGDLKKLDARTVLLMRKRAARRWERFRKTILVPLNEDLKRPSRRAALEGVKTT